MKRERRVAWMLLNAASVDSLEGGVLTMAFAGEGQAKGFAASGHDQVLTGVLATMLGLKVRVRAAVGTVSGAHGARPAPADPAPRVGASGRAAGPGAAGPAGATDRPGGAADRPDGAAAGQARRTRCLVAGARRPPDRRLRRAVRAAHPGPVGAPLAGRPPHRARPGPGRAARPRPRGARLLRT